MRGGEGEGRGGSKGEGRGTTVGKGEDSIQEYKKTLGIEALREGK